MRAVTPGRAPRTPSALPDGNALIYDVLRHHTAEGVGFEPTVPCDTTVFETVRFVRSRIPPKGLAEPLTTIGDDTRTSRAN